MRVLIAGAGIGGLSAALCLHKAGHDVVVLERSAELLEVGAGLQCGANAMHVLRHLELMDKLQAYAVAPEAVLFRDYQSGDVLHSMELGEHYHQQYGAPYWHLYRADLQKVLAEALQERVPNALQLNSSVTEYHETADAVSVTTADGVQWQADVLVGADGIHSSVRRQLLGQVEATYTGNVAWRAVVHRERLPQDWMPKVASNFVGPDKHCVLYYLRDQQMANLVGVVRNPKWQEQSWMARAPKSELLADFSGWHPTVQAIVEAVEENQCYRWALSSLAPLASWRSTCVTLLGDAAHATLPFMAAGAALALEDGRILARALSSCESIEQGLQVYQRNRQARTRRVQQDSARIGALYHLKSDLLRRTAFKSIGLFAARRQAYLPDYNANTVALR